MLFYNYYCYDCNSFFDFPKKRLLRRGKLSKKLVDADYIDACPFCLGRNFEETVKCNWCEKKIAEKEIGLCANCADNAIKNNFMCVKCGKFYNDLQKTIDCCKVEGKKPCIKPIDIDSKMKNLIYKYYTKHDYPRDVNE